jgi:hypothetical protein
LISVITEITVVFGSCLWLVIKSSVAEFISLLLLLISSRTILRTSDLLPFEDISFSRLESHLQTLELWIHGTKECISENKEERTKARGLILYTHRSLQAKEVAMDSEYGENIFVKIVLNSTDCLLIGLLYRSPTERLDGIDNNGNLNKLIVISFKSCCFCDMLVQEVVLNAL